MSKTVQFQDDWGSEHKARVPADTPDTAFAILTDDLPFYAEAIRLLSPKEWQVFFLHYIRKITSTSEIAQALGMRQTGDVRKYLPRIQKKLASVRANLSLVKVCFPDSDGVVEEGIPVVLSRHQLSVSQPVAKEKRPDCRASAPWCPERRTS